MTKKRKLQVNGAVVLLAVGALAVDKLVLGDGSGAGPASAEATPVYEAPRSASAKPGPPPGDTEAGAVSVRLDERLKSFDAVDPPRDPFLLSDTLAARLERQVPQEEADEQSDRPEEQIVEEFRAAHRLEAVLLNGDKSLAIVNGLTVRIGQSLNDFTLVSVEERSAAFEGESVSVTLVLPME